MKKQMICSSFLLALFGWTTVTAFAPTVVDVLFATTSPSAVSLFLHPKQAAELEACAFECYCLESSKVAQRRRSLHNDSRSNVMMSTNGTPNASFMNNKRVASTRRSTGPVAWCRRVISGSAANRRRHG
jgi:hypothetical protein